MSFAADSIADLSYKDFILETTQNVASSWNGRQISAKDATFLSETLQDILARIVFSQDPDNSYNYNILSNFLKKEINPSYFTLASRNIEPIVFTFDRLQPQDNLIIQAGLGKFWKKHKKEIIIGVIVAAVIVTVATIAVVTYGTGSQAAAAAGAATITGTQSCLDNDRNKKSSDPEPSSTSNQNIVPNEEPPITISLKDGSQPGYNKPVFSEEGVLLEDKYYSYWELLQKAKQEEFFSNLLNTSSQSLPDTPLLLLYQLLPFHLICLRNPVIH